MSAVIIQPNRVILSNGLFDSDKNYIQVAANGPIHWPTPHRSIGATQNRDNITLRYKNGVGGVPAYYSGAARIQFRATI